MPSAPVGEPVAPPVATVVASRTRGWTTARTALVAGGVTSIVVGYLYQVGFAIFLSSFSREAGGHGFSADNALYLIPFFGAIAGPATQSVGNFVVIGLPAIAVQSIGTALLVAGVLHGRAARPPARSTLAAPTWSLAFAPMGNGAMPTVSGVW